MKHYSSVVRGVGEGVVGVIFQQQSRAPKSWLEVCAGAEYGPVVDGYFDGLVGRRFEARGRDGREKEDGGPGGVFAFDVAGGEG